MIQANAVVETDSSGRVARCTVCEATLSLKFPMPVEEFADELTKFSAIHDIPHAS